VCLEPAEMAGYVDLMKNNRQKIGIG